MGNVSRWLLRSPFSSFDGGKLPGWVVGFGGTGGGVVWWREPNTSFGMKKCRGLFASDSFDMWP